MKSKWLLGIGMVVGCATGAVVSTKAVSFAPNPTAPRWQQYCERHLGSSAIDEVNAAAATAGADGWEIVSTSVDQAWGIAVCFKRPAP